MSEAEWVEKAAAGAREMRIWVDAFLKEGFSEEQAVAFLCRPLVQTQSFQYPPEMMEAIERQSALATKMLTELDDS